MRLIPLIALTALLLSPAQPVAAHEFWISPNTYMINAGDQLLANLRVGENFKGGASVFLPDRFVRFDVVQDGEPQPVEGRIGDRPALNMPIREDGLLTIVHQTTHNLLTYRDPEKFESFLRHKDAAWVLEAHSERGLPETGFKEMYSRYAKSLIAVGAGEGSDAPVGLITEIVALNNPFTDDLTGGMTLQVLYEGAPRAQAQVEVFARGSDDTVTVTLHQTDEDGRVTIPVAPSTEYLVDAVLLRPVYSDSLDEPVWESLWASLTFSVPD